MRGNARHLIKLRTMAHAAEKILILRLSSIGDVVLTTPIIRALANCFPTAELHFLTKAAYAGLLEAHPLLTRVHRFEGNLEATISALEDEGFDLVVDLHRNIRSALIKMRLGVRSGTYSKDRWPVLLHTKWKLVPLPKVHTVERYARALEPLGCKLDGGGLELYLPVEAHGMAEKVLKGQFNKAPMGVVLGGKYPTKRWPAAHFIELLNALGQAVILFGGPEDKAEAASIAAKLKVPYLNAAGQFNLALSAALVNRCAFVLTHDTGLMHIAAAFQKKIFTLWGNTVPELGFGPYGVEHAVALQVADLSCRPCTKLGYDACPKGHFKCMLDLRPETVLQQIEHWLSTSQ